MDIGAYRRALNEYVIEALENTDGSNSEIYQYLRNKKVSGLFVRNKEEKKKALEEATQAFSKHSHWPLEIVVSHLGVEVDMEKYKK